MTNREHDITALLSQAKTDLTRIQSEYENSLQSKQVLATLKVSIKGLCDHLRSALDYLAHDVKE